MEKLLNDKVKEFKEKENHEFEKIKQAPILIYHKFTQTNT